MGAYERLKETDNKGGLCSRCRHFDNYTRAGVEICSKHDKFIMPKFHTYKCDDYEQHGDIPICNCGICEQPIYPIKDRDVAAINGVQLHDKCCSNLLKILRSAGGTYTEVK